MECFLSNPGFLMSACIFFFFCRKQDWRGFRLRRQPAEQLLWRRSELLRLGWQHRKLALTWTMISTRIYLSCNIIIYWGVSRKLRWAKKSCKSQTFPTNNLVKWEEKWAVKSKETFRFYISIFTYKNLKYYNADYVMFYFWIMMSDAGRQKSEDWLDQNNLSFIISFPLIWTH